MADGSLPSSAYELRSPLSSSVRLAQAVVVGVLKRPTFPVAYLSEARVLGSGTVFVR